MLQKILSKGNALLYLLARHRAYRLALISGVLLAASFPPLPLAFLILFAGLVPLLVIIEEKLVPSPSLAPGSEPPDPDKRRGLRSYWKLLTYTYPMFFVWNLGGCYWLMLTALKVQDSGEAVGAFFAGFLAVALNPLLMYIPVALYLFVRKRTRRSVALFGLSVFWLAFEYLHFNWDLSWSWMTLGHAFSTVSFYVQYIEFTGVLGISLHVIAANALVFELMHRFQMNSMAEKNAFQTKWQGTALAVLLLLPLIVNPALTRTGRAAFQPAGELNVRVVQPNIDPYVKFNYKEEKKHLQTFMELAAAPGADSIDLVVLPETALPFSVWKRRMADDFQLNALRQLRERHGFDILAGMVFRQELPPGALVQPWARAFPDRPGQYYTSHNAAMMIGDTTVYFKGKLVPLVEGIPFAKHADFFEQFNLDIGGGFSAFGPPDSLIALQTKDGVRVAPIICYESQFGEYVAGVVGKGAQMGAIITNDGWYGNTSGYIQHAFLAALRAVETRRDIARSANTGMSLFVDARGTMHDKLGWWRRGVLDRKIVLYDYQTFFVRHGSLLGPAAVFFSFCVLLLIPVKYVLGKTRRP